MTRAASAAWITVDVEAFAAHRLAAEKAERERIADWLDEYADSAIDSLVADLAKSIRAGEYER